MTITMNVLLFNLCLLCTFLPPTSPSSVSDLPLVVSNNNPAANDVEKYRALVEELEDSVGRHHPKVAEALIQLAQILSQLNLYAEADETLDRSLQITRLSDGIFSSTQAHVLYLKIHNSIFLGDWEKTNKIMERLQRLKYRKNEELIKALISLSDVHFNAIPFDSEKNQTWHLQNALALNWGTVIVGKTVWGNNSLRLTPIYYDLISKYYIRTVAVNNGGIASTDIRRLHPGASRYMSSKDSKNYDYLTGLSLFNSMRELYSSDGANDIEAMAMIDLYIADWNLLYNKSDNLQDAYEDVYAQLISMGLEERRLDDYFSSPVILPVPTLYTRFEDALLAKQDLQQPLYLEQVEILSSTEKDAVSIVKYDEWSRAFPGVQSPLSSTKSTAQSLPDGFDYALILAHIEPLNRIEIKNYTRKKTLLGHASSSEILGQFPTQSHSTGELNSILDILKFRPGFLNGKLQPALTAVQYIFAAN